MSGQPDHAGTVPVRPLDRDSPMPLWSQLEADLRRRIDAGDFGDGRFPTDLELTDTYEVSRHTVREAIRHLNRSGLLTRQRGRGTVINRSEFEQRLGTLYSLFASIEATGIEQTSDVLELGIVTDDTVAFQLDLPDDTELVFLARVRRAGGEPLALDRAWLPRAIAEPLLEVDWSHTALYTEMTRIGAPTPTAGWERMAPVIPNSEDRALLGLDPSSAVFSIERLGTCDGQPVEWRTTLIRGDRYRFVTEWSPTSAGGRRLRATE